MTEDVTWTDRDVLHLWGVRHYHETTPLILERLLSHFGMEEIGTVAGGTVRRVIWAALGRQSDTALAEFRVVVYHTDVLSEQGAPTLRPCGTTRESAMTRDEMRERIATYSLDVMPTSRGTESVYVARYGEMPGYLSEGSTELEAVAELKEIAIPFAESYLADGVDLPLPTPAHAVMMMTMVQGLVVGAPCPAEETSRTELKGSTHESAGGLAIV